MIARNSKTLYKKDVLQNFNWERGANHLLRHPFECLNIILNKRLMMVFMVHVTRFLFFFVRMPYLSNNAHFKIICTSLGAEILRNKNNHQ